MKTIKQLSKLVLAMMISLSFVSVSQAAGQALPSRLPKKVAAAASFTGFKVASRNCRVYKAPRRSAKSKLKLSKGKKLWLEPFDMHWSIGYRKSGDAIFIPNFCFKKVIQTASR